MVPQTKYAKSGDVHIAYQVVGNGPIDLVYSEGWITHLECNWEDPTTVRFFERLASFSRLILFDKRGTGLSDRVPVNMLPTLEQRMDDLRAVMDAAGSERAALFGVSEGGPMSMLFAATYPQRVSALLLYGTFPRFLSSDDYPFGLSAERVEQGLELIEKNWGDTTSASLFNPSLVQNERRLQWHARLFRLAASPSAAVAMIQMAAQIDVRHLLHAIRVPTLVLHRVEDPVLNVEGGRYLAQHIPSARMVELSGPDHDPVVGDQDVILDEIEEFLTGERRGPEPDRVLATVLFSDIVDSTKRAAELGDRRWRELLENYHATVRSQIARFRGREIDTAGDGVFATFDGPARSIRCADAIRESVRGLNIEVRAGLHTGECELHGSGNVSGIAVHTGARVVAAARPNEIL